MVSLTRSSTAWCGRSMSTPPRNRLARARADLLALIETVLEDFVGLKPDVERLVDFPPQELMALDAAVVTGFGEVVQHTSECGGGV